MLTTWQAKFLLSGRYRLRIGNYFLLSRLRRDELGARYLAVHASLKRKVELQIFSRDLTSDTQRWKDMIKKASLVAKLDHPALVHVYDIDHDDDRYFLVVEHVAGRPLDVQKEIFTTPQIGKLVLQCAEGIEVAHQNKVVHGTIDQTDILLTDKGTVKLQNLTVSPMRNSSNNVPEAKPEADFVALAVLGNEILQANPGADGGPGIGLSAIFELMKTDGPRAIKKLEQWVEATPDAGASNAEVTKSGANPIFSPTPGSNSGIDLSKTDTSTIDVAERDDHAAATSSASIVEAAWSSRPFLIAIAIGMVMFCGIMGYGFYRAYNTFVYKPAQTAAVAKTEKEDLQAKRRAAHNAKEQKAFEAQQAKNQAPGNGAKRPKGPRDNKKATAKQRNRAANRNKAAAQTNQKPPKNNNVANAMDDEPKPNGTTPAGTASGEPAVDDSTPDDIASAEAKSGETEPAQADSEQAEPAAAPNNKFMDIFGKRSTQTSSEPDEKTAGTEKMAEKGGIPPVVTDPDNLQKLKNIGRVTENALKKAGVKTYDQIVKMTPEQLDKALEAGGTNKLGEKKWKEIIEEAKPLAEVSLSNAADHFRKVPEVFDLPAVDSSNPVVLTKLLIPANYSLTTELISPDGISPKRIFFELNKVAGSEAWTVASKKTKSGSKSTDIATFTKSSDSLSFAWLPEAAKNKSAVYLRNCLLRLSTPDGRSSISKLRKPVVVRSLRINAEDMLDSVKIEIEGIPDSDNLQIQLGALQNRQRSIQIIDPSCTLDSPAIVALRRRETNGFLVLQVAVERSGGGFKLSAGLTFNGKVLKSSDQLKAIQDQLAGVVANAKQRLQTKPKDRDLRSQVNAAENNLNRMNDYMESVKWLFEGGGGVGEPINFNISADFEDGRVLLGRSDKNMVDENKKKKK